MSKSTPRSKVTKPAAKPKAIPKAGANISKEWKRARTVDDMLRLLDSEKQGAISMEILNAIERFIIDGGRTRRAALAYLTKPWPEMADKIVSDRETAVSFAAIVDCIENDLGTYRELAHLMEAAHSRMLIAIAGRKDMDSVIAKGHAIGTHAYGDVEEQIAQVYK